MASCWRCGYLDTFQSDTPLPEFTSIMRLYSTADSVRCGEVSVLAICETLAAIIASYLFGLWAGSWWHIPVGATIGFFTLLRTDRACVMSLAISTRYNKFLKSFDASSFPQTEYRDARTALACALVGLATAVVLYLLAPFFAVLWKIAATSGCLLFRFRETIRAIPRNFLRATISVDLCVSPEFYPLPDDPAFNAEFPEEQRRLNSVYSMLPACATSSVIRGISYEADTWWEKVIYPSLLGFGAILMAIQFVVICGIAMSYRFSVKMTALVWFPLWWALTPVTIKPVSRPWSRHLEMEWDQGRPQFDRMLSTFTLVLFVAAYLIWASRITASNHLASLGEWISLTAPTKIASIMETIAATVYPGALHLWQLAAMANALLGLMQFRLIKRWLVMFRHDEAPTDSNVERWLHLLFKVRWPLTVYASACNLYIAYQIALLFPAPKVDSRLFPWQ